MEIDEILQIATERMASDVHIRAGGPPYLRIDGALLALEAGNLSSPDTERMAFDLMTEDQARTFKQTNEADFAYTLPGVARFRVNAFRQRGAVGVAIRRVLPGSTTFDALGLPDAVRSLAEEPRGLILVTGMTGSGKTTTTAAMLNHINATRRCHIVTIEDPIEVLHTDKLAIIDQREVGIDTNDFQTALRHVARQDPDVIFIGEMRDTETVQAAMRAAETGHLVISTLHTLDATETVNRIIDFFPPHQHQQARLTLAGTLRGVVSQRLIVRNDGMGRVPAVEILVMNGRIFDMIVKPDQTHLIEDVIREGDFYGMQTFDQHLVQLVRAGIIGVEDATSAATSAHDLSMALVQHGIS